MCMYCHVTAPPSQSLAPPRRSARVPPTMGMRATGTMNVMIRSRISFRLAIGAGASSRDAAWTRAPVRKGARRRGCCNRGRGRMDGATLQPARLLIGRYRYALGLVMLRGLTDSLGAMVEPQRAGGSARPLARNIVSIFEDQK